jgi:ATP-dependent Clp protease protease subunit
MRERMNRIIARQTGQSLERIQNDTRRNFWLDAEAAKEYGIVGRIVEHTHEVE